jgi:hypothetical protein
LNEYGTISFLYLISLCVFLPLKINPILNV